MSELGELVRTHRGSPWKHITPAVLSGAMTIAGIWAIAVMKPPDPGKASLVVLLFAAVTVLFIVLAVRAGNSRLFLHERGIVYARGSARTVVRFGDIAAVTERRFNGKAAQLILRLRGGREESIEATIENYEHAAQTIADNAGV